MVLGALLVLGVSPALAADPFAAEKQRRVAACAAIPASDYSTGMIFNPPGQATLFHRARCFQELAVEEHDASLCAEVRERKSWFFDGSAVSEPACRAAVAERIARTDREFAARDFATLHRLTSFRLQRNGNGRDFDLLVMTEGALYGLYEIDMSIASPGHAELISVFRRSYPHGGSTGPRWILLRRQVLADRLGPAFMDAALAVTVTLRYEKTVGNRLYYDRIPAHLRESRLRADLRLADLPPWQPEEIGAAQAE